MRLSPSNAWYVVCLMVHTNALCMDATNPNTVMKLTHSDSLNTWSSAHCRPDLIKALCRSTNHAWWCGTLYLNVTWLYAAQSSTSVGRMPISHSKVSTFILPMTFIHAIVIRSNRPLTLRIGDVIRSNRLVQQPLGCTMGLPFAPPKPG